MLSPRNLALAYDRYVAARWRGDDAGAGAFAAWLEARWSGEAPPEPGDGPDAVSVLGGAGGGILWYRRGGAILGYATGRPHGCYWVAPDAAPPAVPVSGTGPPGDDGNRPQ